MDALISLSSGLLTTLKVVIGFSLVIFVHELGHFLAAKWMGVRVDRFAIGFFRRIVGYRRGEGITFGTRPAYKTEELAAKGYGETDYCLNVLPFGGYVKMLGEDDVQIDEKTGAMLKTDDPRAFNNKPVWRRMLVVSAGVVFNALFAILAYAYIFMGPGLPVAAPVVGEVLPGSSAAVAGLRSGDVVLSVDGARVDSFEEVRIRTLLGSGRLRLEVQRDGQTLDEPLVMDRPERIDGKPIWEFECATTTQVLRFDETAAGLDTILQGLRSRDRVTHVDGVPVSNQTELLLAVRRSGGRPLKLSVERERPDAGAPARVEVEVWPRLVVGEDRELPGRLVRTSADRQHILGLCGRHVVVMAEPGQPGAEAGFKPGDVIAAWGGVAHPRFSEIDQVVERSEGRPIQVVVERDGKPVQLTVTPRRAFQVFKTARYRVGVHFEPEVRRAVVSDVLPNTPAAELGMPRGAEIVAIDEKPVTNWMDAVEALKAGAGSVVSVRYRAGPDEVVAPMRVPSSLVNELNLPPAARVLAINGERFTELRDGTTSRLPEVSGVRALLAQHVGESVTVEYVTDVLSPEVQRATFRVTDQNCDPWQLRLRYDFPPVFTLEQTLVHAQGDPLRALVLGTQRAGEDLQRIFLFLSTMVRSAFQREKAPVGVGDVTGPIGIVAMAAKHAQTSYAELLMFLAYISINLAIINFLPFPVVDGGLMVFLLIEWLRGKPMSVKVQVATTLTGLALIVLCFVLVTFQDIMRWVGGTL